MSDQTLMGRKLEIYVMLKILKYFTNSPVKSYQLKFVLSMALANKTDKDMGDMNSAIQVRWRLIAGKANLIHNGPWNWQERWETH